MRRAFAALPFALLVTASAAAPAQRASDLPVMLLNQVRSCWAPPANAPPVVVSFDVSLNRDGGIAQPPQLSASQDMSSPFLLEWAEAGRRAIATCAPYKLPADRYDEWRNIRFNFDPNLMTVE